MTSAAPLAPLYPPSQPYDCAELAVSGGSACHSARFTPSHVLTAMGLPPELAQASVRFSLGRFTTEAEVDQAIEVFLRVVRRLRS